MSPEAIETFSTFGVGTLCIVLGVMVLSIFFTALSWLTSRGAKPETMAVHGVLKDTWATVRMLDGETFDRVRFLGITNTEGIKPDFTQHLNGMVILEDPQGKQYLVRAKAIRTIILTPESERSPSKQT
jgi:hypothetical protein